MSIRENIIKSAYQAFYEHGFHACGVAMLAERAGVTKRTLYAHFESKEILIQAVLQYRHEQFIAMMLKSLEDNLDDVATAYLTFIQNWGQSDDFFGCFFINACAEFSNPMTAPNQYAQEHKRQIRNILKEYFIKNGVENAQQAADKLFLLGEGLIVAYQTGQKDINGPDKITTLQTPVQS